MAAENLFINDSCYWQAIEAICECLPQLDIVSAFAFVVETINAIYASTLMIASEKEEVLRILDFVSEQKANGLQGLLAAIHVITQE